jgi:hypothetical protein
MQARNLPPAAAAAGLDDADVDGVELLELEPDDPQAAASRATTPAVATIRIFALKMYLLCPGARWCREDAGSITSPGRLGQGKSVQTPPGLPEG